MIDWHDPKKKLPTHGESCLLLNQDHSVVFGPISWHEQGKMWLDLFATAGAGECVSIDAVSLWTAWDAIAPKEDQTDD